MERLTYRDANGKWVIACNQFDKWFEKKYPAHITGTAVNKLAAYEDVGSVEEFAAYKQAESDGRLVVRKRPPVKRGDTVYTITNEEIMEREVIEITCGDGWCRIACHASQGRQYAFGILDIGKTVFLTRAEAEAALAAKEGGNDD